VSVRRALDDPHWAVRAQAAKALGRMHAHHCEDALAAKLCDSAWWVRRHAAYALADLGEPGQLALANVVRSSTDRYAREMAREALDHDWGRESA
jgi:HEAT repeat protein